MFRVTHRKYPLTNPGQPFTRTATCALLRDLRSTLDSLLAEAPGQPYALLRHDTWQPGVGITVNVLHDGTLTAHVRHPDDVHPASLPALVHATAQVINSWARGGRTGADVLPPSRPDLRTARPMQPVSELR